MAMNILILLLTGVCSLSSLVGAMIVTKYKITPAPASTDVLPCGESASSADFCAARVTNDNTCVPLTKDWCEAKDMSMGGFYMVKQTIQYVPENTYVSSFKRPVPIYMTIGSEVDMKFVLRTSQSFTCWLRDADGNFVLRTSVSLDMQDITSLWRIQGGFFQDSETWPLPSYIDYDTECTLTIRCDVNSFDIYINGVYIWTYSLSQLPAKSITEIRILFPQEEGELHYVAFQAGP